MTARIDKAVVSGVFSLDGQDFDAMPLGILHELRGVVEAHGLAVDGTEESRWLMALEPGTGVDQ